MIAKRRFGFGKKILETGLPRNDIFFSHNSEIVQKTKSMLGIPETDGIVLYAPTYRGGWTSPEMGVFSKNPIDSEKVVAILERMNQKKFHFVFRGHHCFRDTLNIKCIDATSYHDMQELLFAADVLITDYSSSLWDFSLTYKPCFMYVPDLSSYSVNPGFESDYRDWPFPYATNNEKLVEEIKNFDSDKYKKAVCKYHSDYGSYERGDD